MSLAKAAVGATGSVREWHRGVGALAGTLKPGTPVATFLDAFGRNVDRYANGGTGTPGAHLDHAGIFQNYIRDKAGNIVGMNIAEQYAGSHGVHRHAYYNRGWGERNAGNYSAILGSDGRPLGGSRNPLGRSEPLPSLSDRPRGRDTREQTAAAELHVHLHDPGRNVRSTRLAGGDRWVRPKLHTWPTMTEPSDDA